MNTRKKSKNPVVDEAESLDSSFADYWDKLELKLQEWVKSTLPNLVKETIQIHTAKIVDDYVSSDDFQKSLTESIHFDASQLNDRVEGTEKKINDLVNANDSTISQLKQKLTDIDKKIVEFEEKNSHQLEEMDNLEQYTRRTNIRIYGISEDTDESTDEIAIKFFKDELGVAVTQNDISRSHRVGKKYLAADKKPRPIIVRFVKHNTKVAVLICRRVLKDNKRPYNIQEDLTFSRRKILAYLSKDIVEGIISKVWTIDGTIFLRPSCHSSTIERCTSLKKCQEIVAKYS